LVLSQRVQSFLCSLEEQSKMFPVDRKPAYLLMTLLSYKFTVLVLYCLTMRSAVTFIKPQQMYFLLYFLYTAREIKHRTEEQPTYNKLYQLIVT
jgi:hypothetical protein